MAEQYYSILTNRGKELEAASSASGTPVIIKDFVIGDGNGRAAAPDPAQTALVREVYRHAISKLDVSHEQPNQWVAHLVLPADVGGFADWEAPAGCFMTGMNTNEGGDGRRAGLYFRALYYFTPSAGWVQAGDIA